MADERGFPGCTNAACPCGKPLSPWAQDIVDRCKREGRKATFAEELVLYGELANLGEAAMNSLEEKPRG